MRNRLIYATLIPLLITVLFVIPQPVSAMGTCSWTGDTSTNWFEPSNWNCGVEYKIPSNTDNVNISFANNGNWPEIESPTVDQPVQVQIGALTLGSNATLSLQDTAVLKTSGWNIAFGNVTLAGFGTLEGNGTIPADTSVTLSGNLKGNLTVEPGGIGKNPGILKIGTLGLGVYGDVLLNGNVSADSLHVLEFYGANFTNNGEYRAPVLRFMGGQEGAPATQVVKGTGRWIGTRLDVFGSGLSFLSTNLLLEDSELNYVSGTLNCIGEIRTQGNSKISVGYSVSVPVPVHIVSGTTTAYGYFSSYIDVDLGSTLRVAAGQIMSPGGIFRLRGSLTGEDATSVFRYTGPEFLHDGLISISQFKFAGIGEQRYFTTNVSIDAWDINSTLSIEPTSTVNIGKDLKLGIKAFNINHSGASSPNLNITSFHLILQNPTVLTINGSSLSPSIVAGEGSTWSKIKLMGGTTINNVGNTTIAPEISVESGINFVTGNYSETPFTIKGGAELYVPTGQSTLLTGTTKIEAGGKMTGASMSSLTVMTSTFDNYGQIVTQGTFSMRPLYNTMLNQGQGSVDAYNLNFSSGQAVYTNNTFKVSNQLTVATQVNIAPPGEMWLLNTATLSASSSPDFDIIGIIRRTGPFQNGTTYTFGNPNIYISFDNSPAESVTLNHSRDTVSGLFGAINHSYAFSATGTSQSTYALVSLHWSKAEARNQGQFINAWSTTVPGLSGPWTRVIPGSRDNANNWMLIYGGSVLQTYTLTYTQSVYLPVTIR